MRVNGEIAAALTRGDTFVVFPEGTTTTGKVLLPFQASLLQPAIGSGALLYPAALRYTRGDGSLCSEADYDGAKTMLETVRLILTQPEINLRLQFLAPLACAGRHRRDLAHEAAALIARALSVSAPSSRAERAAGPTA
jgi:1-acyl-sn-glycerol-3-phosphate acyltransferase